MADAVYEKLARMTLLVLRASQPDQSILTDYQLRPAVDSLSEEEVVRALAQLEKPIECAADHLNGTLRIRWTPVNQLSTESFYAYQLAALRSGRGLFATAIRELRRAGGREAILSSDSQSIACNADELELWQEQYALAGPTSIVVYRESSITGFDALLDIKVARSSAGTFNGRVQNAFDDSD
jgi:hypothetical protein